MGLLCELLFFQRSSFYYTSKAVDDSHLRKAIEEICLKQTRYGYRRIIDQLNRRGIGKSRLVSELKTDLASHVRSHDADREASTTPPLILEGRCVSIGQTISYWPFIDILRTDFDLREEDDEPAMARKVVDGIEALFDQQAMDVLPLIGNLLSMDLGDEVSGRLTFATPEQIRHQTLMRLRDVFETLARKPCCLKNIFREIGDRRAEAVMLGSLGIEYERECDYANLTMLN